MSSHTVAVREGVIVLEERHGLEDLKNVAKVLEKNFGIKVFQVHLHRDEGKGEAVFRKDPNGPVQTGKIIKAEERNFHGHIVAKWVDEKGKTLRLRRHHMQNMQTVVAQELGMPRGKKGSKAVRLEALEYTDKKLRERLAEVTQSLKDFTKLLLEKKKELEAWISSTKERLSGLRKGLKETSTNRIDRLKAVPAEQVIRHAVALKLAPAGQFVPAPSNKVQDSKQPELKPKSTVDFLFKDCEMEFKDCLGLLDQLRDQRDRLARLKAVPAEMVIRRAEELKLAPAGQFVPAPFNKVQNSKRPELKPKPTVDFLFKDCKMEFKDSLELLDQLRDQQHTKSQEQTKSQGQGLRRRLKVGM